MNSDRWQGWRVYAHPRVRTLFFLGFSSGLPLLLVFGTLSVWLREAGIERSTIGFISWVTLAYGLKWLWSPLLDKWPLPFLTRRLGRRRSWLIFSQILIMLALLGMAHTDPSQNLNQLIGLAVGVAFASATQDIAIDAFRIEAAPADIQAALAASYLFGYRLAMILASAGVFWIADWLQFDSSIYDQHAWQIAYSLMAFAMSIGLITALLTREPQVPDRAEIEIKGQTMIEQKSPPFFKPILIWLWTRLISPFADFIYRYRGFAILILALIATYRISDVVLGAISNVFYIDLGFTKSEIANITKVFGIIMTLLGAALGGVLVDRFGIMRILFIGAILAAATNLSFAFLARTGPDISVLILVIMADNLSAGLATAAFVAYLSALTNIAYSATQYALFSSIMLLLPKFIGGFSGVMVDQFGYSFFFILTALMGIPVLILVLLVWHWIPVDE